MWKPGEEMSPRRSHKFNNTAVNTTEDPKINQKLKMSSFVPLVVVVWLKHGRPQLPGYFSVCWQVWGKNRGSFFFSAIEFGPVVDSYACGVSVYWTEDRYYGQTYPIVYARVTWKTAVCPTKTLVPPLLLSVLSCFLPREITLPCRTVIGEHGRSHRPSAVAWWRPTLQWQSK
jgi:hypothetical protein